MKMRDLEGATSAAVGRSGTPDVEDRVSAAEGESRPSLSEMLEAARHARRRSRSGSRAAGPPTPDVAAPEPRVEVPLRTSMGLSGHLYVPSSPPARAARILVAVHGVTRNRRELAAELLHLVPEDVALLLPFFSQKRFRGYQRLEAGRGGASPALELQRLLALANEVTSLRSRCVLFGFSGGAQFAHRFAMMHPNRVESLIAVAAGFYTMPNPEIEFPYGVKPARALRERIGEADWRAYLACPKHVFVGALDTERDRHLRQDRDLDRSQGRDRVERARRYALATRSAEIREIGRPLTRFTILQGSGHTLRGCMADGGLGFRLAALLRDEAERSPVSESLR